MKTIPFVEFAIVQPLGGEEYEFPVTPTDSQLEGLALHCDRRDDVWLRLLRYWMKHDADEA